MGTKGRSCRLLGLCLVSLFGSMVLARMNDISIGVVNDDSVDVGNKGKVTQLEDLVERDKFELTEKEEKLARSNYAEMKFAERMAAVTGEALRSYVLRSIRTIDRRLGLNRITEDDFFPLIHDATRFGGLDTMLDEFLLNFRRQRENGEPPLITDARGATLVDTLYYLLTQKQLHMSLPPPADPQKQKELNQEAKSFFLYVDNGRFDSGVPDMFETLGRIDKEDRSAPRVLVDEVFLQNFDTLARRDKQEYKFRRAALTLHSKKFTRGGRFQPKPGETVKKSIKFVIPVGFINGINPFNQLNAKGVIENLLARFSEAIPTEMPSEEKELLGVRDCVAQLKEIENKKKFSVPVEYICIAKKKVLFDGVMTRLRQSLSLQISDANVVWMHPSDIPLTEDNWGDYNVLAARLAPRYPSEEQWVDVYRRLAPCRDQAVFEEFPPIAADPIKFVAFGLNNIAHAFKDLVIPEDHSIFIPKPAKSFSLLAMMFTIEKGRHGMRTPTIIESNDGTSADKSTSFVRRFKNQNVVVIDDVAGSGETLFSACSKAFKWGAKSCSVAPIILSDAARKFLEPDKKEDVIETADKQVLTILDKQTVPVKSVDYNKNWMGDSGFRDGKYFVFFPYMVPDNNVYVANMVLGQEFTDHSAIKFLDPKFMPKKFKAPVCLRAGL